MHTSNTDHDETLKEEIEQALKKDFNNLLVKEFTTDWKVQRLKIGLDIEVMDFDNLMQLIKEDRERALREAISTTIRRERDRSFAEHMKVQEFYAGGKRRLKELAFPSHCSSCHSEWEDGYGDQEEPCCSRAKSNIIDSIMKWHINESADEIKKVEAELSNPTQEKESR